jgi:hypothetical protein
MAEAENESNTSVGNTPTGKRHEVSIGIQQPQHVSLTPWVQWIRNAVAGVGRLLPGRPRKYNVDGKITAVAEALIRDEGVDDHLDRLIERVRIECKVQGIEDSEMPKSRGQMRKILRSTWEAARTKK